MRSGCVGGKGYLHSHNCNFFPWSRVCSDQWTPYRETSAHHRCSFLRRNVFGDGKGEVFVSSDMAGIAALRDRSIGVWRSIGIYDSSARSERTFPSTITHQLGVGSSSRCQICRSCTLSMPRSARQHQRGLQPLRL